jgi:DNA-binding beta-propeller fold protein YncE
MVANGGNGSCQFYNSATFQITGAIALGSDADDIRYDSAGKKIYVGYGSGGIAEIEPVKHQKTADIKLPGHPEGFQLDRTLRKIFVNVPDANQIDVIDLKNAEVVAKWKTDYNANFPMAIDGLNHIIFIGYRHPAKLVAIDGNTGKTIATTDLIGDADDLYYDGQSRKIYASGGSGAINVYLFQKSDFKQIAGIATRSGARTSLLIPTLNTFILAERETGNEAAQLTIYKTK